MSEETPDTLAEADRLLNVSEKDLLTKLSSELGYDQAFPGDLVAKGRQLYENVKSNAQSQICDNDKVYSIARSQVIERRALLVCAIADLLAGKGAFTCAALIVKEGVETLCKTPWSCRE